MNGGEGWPGRDPQVIADELEGFTTAQLLAEVARRERALREQIEGPVLCEGCVHQRFWKHRSNPPEGWTACDLGHGLDFWMTDDPHGDGSGFYRPGGCTGRAEPPPPPPTPEPPRPPRGGKPVGVPVRPAEQSRP